MGKGPLHWKERLGNGRFSEKKSTQAKDGIAAKMGGQLKKCFFGQALIKAKDWSDAGIAADCGITQPRMNDLMTRRLSKFSLDDLVNISTALNQRVHLKLECDFTQ